MRMQSRGGRKPSSNAQARGKACYLVLWVGSFIIWLESNEKETTVV
jgi:hypothetical protein